MHSTPVQYAEGLISALNRSDTSARSDIIDRFIALVVRDRRRKDLPAIFRHVERLMYLIEGKNFVRIVSAKPLSSLSQEVLHSEAEKIFGTDQFVFESTVHPRVIGGAVFQSDTDTVDASVGGRLRKLKRFLEKNR